MSKITCKLPIDFIKREFLRERGVETDKYSTTTIYKAIKPSEGVVHEIDQLIHREGQRLMAEEVMACQNETQLDNVFSKWARLSLHEWIESL